MRLVKLSIAAGLAVLASATSAKAQIYVTPPSVTIGAPPIVVAPPVVAPVVGGYYAPPVYAPRVYYPPPRRIIYPARPFYGPRYYNRGGYRYYR